MRPPRIGFIGGGNMARSLIGGLVAGGWSADDIYVSEPESERRGDLTERFGVRGFADNRPVAEAAEALVLAVKPQVMRDVCQEVAGTVSGHLPLTISIAAGVRSADMLRWLGAPVPLVRVMPNTPALVGAGASALYAGADVSTAQRETAQAILAAVGVTVWLEHESLMDAVTALSGSGPAYFFYLMETACAAAVELGLPEETARQLTLETALGAARLAADSGEPFATLRRRVTSPNGTTEAALNVMLDRDMGATVRAALGAAAERSRELGDVLGGE